MPGKVQKILVGLTSAAMLFGSLAMAGTVSAASQGASMFADVTATTPHAEAINFLAATGLVEGVGNNLYDPQGPVTRAEMAKIVVDMLGDQSFAQAMSYTTPSFTDASSIPSWAVGYVNVASALGIVNGFPNGTFEPNGNVTEVEAVAMLLRAIGDNTYVTSKFGTEWPGDYVVAAYDTRLASASSATAPLGGLKDGLVTGLSNFFANLPANRGEIAQLVYNAGVNEIADADTGCSGTPEVCLLKNASSLTSLWVNGVNNLSVVEGNLTGWNTSSLTMSNGTSYSLANDYQVIGADSLQALVNMPVRVALNSSNDVVAVKLASNAKTTLDTGVVASSNPNNYTEISISSSTYPWYVDDASGNPALLLSDGSRVPLAGTVSYYVNAPSTGPSTDTASTYVNMPQVLNGGDSISYVTNSSGQITAVYDTHVTYMDGLVTGVDNTNNTLTFTTPSGSSVTVANQGYSVINLNGVASSWSNLATNQIVDVDTVGGYAAGKGDSDIATLNAYNATATGDVTQVNVNSSNNVTSFVLENAAGTSTTYNISSNYQGGASAANGVLMPSGTLISDTTLVTVRLSGGGNAVYIFTVAPSLQAGYMTGYSTVESSSGSTYYAYVNTGTGSMTIDLGSTKPSMTSGPVIAQVNPATLTAAPEDTSPVTTWYVISNSSNSVVVADAAPGSVNSSTQYLYISGSSNAVVNSDGSNLGYSGLASGDTVNLYVSSNLWVVVKQ
jgi:hypothetical protein